MRTRSLLTPEAVRPMGEGVDCTMSFMANVKRGTSTCHPAVLGLVYSAADNRIIVWDAVSVCIVKRVPRVLLNKHCPHA